MTAEEWLVAYAAALGQPAPAEAEMASILRLASVAAHASERRAAPIACWIAAQAGIPLDEALRIADEVAPPDERA